GLHGLNPGGFGGLGANRLGAGGLGAGGLSVERSLGETGRLGLGRQSGLSPLGARGTDIERRLGETGSLGLGRTGAGGERPPTRGGLNSFLGLPSDAGLHHVSRPGEGWDASRGVARGPLGGVAAGGRVEGPLGGEAGRGVAVGPRGNVVGGRGVRGPAGNAVGQGFAAGPRGFRSISAAHLNNGAMAVRRNFHNYGLYSGDWYRRYPGAWYAAGWGAGYAWRAATWDAVGGWFDYGELTPIYYDYGTNVVYQNNNVYVIGQDAGTAQQYYEQAQQLADAGAQADAPTDEKWLPLGVFAMTRPDNSSANMDIQLAVNKAGIIRGNFTDTVTQEVKPINGSVDKKTQRACWTVGKNTETVMETGLYNLTKDEAPALIHFGADRTQQWMLVRIKQRKEHNQTPQNE
ncbi:MAG: protocadherin, partial [Planctomycetota bacterium]|nr:protocadherin [Planctomycetota bacterium]